MSCAQDKGDHGLMTTPAEDRGDAAEVWRSPSYRKGHQTTWSLLVPGFEFGGRSGEFAIFSPVGNRIG